MRDGYNVRVILFDDLRVELNDKLTIVGMHTQGIKLNGTAPAALPQLCLGAWISYPLSPMPETIRIIAKGDTLDDPALDTTMSPRQETEPRATDQSGFRTEFLTNRWVFPTFNANGTISVDVFADDELIFAAYWPVTIAPNPNPMIPPAIQFGPSA
ncbi:hypothetical protein [Niveispirillum cyanobacteriorum]|uniref:Uncharacterized protein n=1 Tax=Niveispirillum cyanobacteriorum TaxID=1612173 RepID=A0A2K9NKY2_9PROT|nr:hypothetical protein [Niveispirillum cyanobacteriorum]AUN33296.1 hypothetical protein C0V82_23275 [Niveispirillum cyanobacteriorum]GGE49887.1 hypothetical protein GCM10011317_05360 [Niveispirillum cyanobacteriorum]